MVGLLVMDSISCEGWLVLSLYDELSFSHRRFISKYPIKFAKKTGTEICVSPPSKFKFQRNFSSLDYWNNCSVPVFTCCVFICSCSAQSSSLCGDNYCLGGSCDNNTCTCSDLYPTCSKPVSIKIQCLRWCIKTVRQL